MFGSCRINNFNGCGRGLEFRLAEGFWVYGLLELFILHDPHVFKEVWNPRRGDQFCLQIEEFNHYNR